jgi:cytochrome c peroxidase
MHDGRFETLEEVLEHYNSGGFPTDNRHPLLRPLNLTSKQKQDIIAFLHTLTDTTFLQNPLFSNPFE